MASNRAYSCLEIKAASDEQRMVEGIATTPKIDRQGDIVDPMGVTFGEKVPLLLYHDSTLPVGEVRFGQPTKKGIPFKAFLPKVVEEGRVKERVEEAWHSIKYRLIGAVSIGFRALEDGIERIETGYKFTKTEILELSLVPIPAQDEAVITSFKSMDDAAIKSIKDIIENRDNGEREAAEPEIQRDAEPAATGKKRPVVHLNASARDRANKPFVIQKIHTNPKA